MKCHVIILDTTYTFYEIEKGKETIKKKTITKKTKRKRKRKRKRKNEGKTKKSYLLWSPVIPGYIVSGRLFQDRNPEFRTGSPVCGGEAPPHGSGLFFSVFQNLPGASNNS